jgi:DNA repair exonuclease SbcCD ATPase subunit
MISSASMGGLGGGGSGSMDAQREQDLAQLQREYRHMELNRRAYAEESQQVLRKQQAKLDQLRKENEALKAELALECRSYRKPSSGGVGERIMLLRQKAIDSEAQVDAERQSCVVMQQQIDLLRKKILHLRKVMGGVNAAQENDIMIQKQVRILEDRLDKALMKFNESLSHNKALRQEIDDLRRERVVFEGIQGKLEKELADKKRQMAAIIEQSNVAYEQRDSYQMEAAAIEQADQRERQDFSSQINELTQALDGASQPPARMAAPHPGSLVDSEDTSTPIHRAGASGPWGGSSASDRVDLQASADRVLVSPPEYLGGLLH